MVDCLAKRMFLGECVGVWLDGHMDGSKGGWLVDWDLGSIDVALIGCQLGGD